MKYLMVLASAFVLTACGTTHSVTLPGTLEGVKESVEIDPRLLEECASVPDLPANPTPSDVLQQQALQSKERSCLRGKSIAMRKLFYKAFNLPPSK